MKLSFFNTFESKFQASRIFLVPSLYTIQNMDILKAPQPQENPQIFEVEYYQRLYDIEEKHWWARGMRDAMFFLLHQPLAAKQKMRVLDVGCGTGYLMDSLKRHYPAISEICGIDISTHALEFCKLRGAEQLLLASATDIPLDSESFDLIICIDTIQHLSPAGADQTAIAELARLLKPDGILYLRTNSALGHPALEGVDPDLYRRYRRETILPLCHKAGLEIERATYLNAIPSVLAMIKEYISVYLRRTPQKTAASGPSLTIKPPKPNSSLLSRLMHRILRFEAWLIGTFKLDLPFGHSLALVARRPNNRAS